MAWAHDVVRVRVPATSANLGPGFDALGLALTLYDEVDAWIRPAGLSIEISGEGEDLADAGEEHLVVRAMRAAFALTGTQPPGIGLRCVNQIPHGILDLRKINSEGSIRTRDESTLIRQVIELHRHALSVRFVNTEAQGAERGCQISGI